MIRAARSTAWGRSGQAGGITGLLNAAEAPGSADGDTDPRKGGAKGSPGAMQRAAKPKGALNRGGVGLQKGSGRRFLFKKGLVKKVTLLEARS